MAGQHRGSGVDVDSSDFMAKLAKAFSQLELDSAQGLEHTGIDVVNRSREMTPVDTGRLRAGATHVMGKDSVGPYCDVGSNVNYDPYVELGTENMDAQPHWRPALAEASGMLRRRVRKR